MTKTNTKKDFYNAIIKVVTEASSMGADIEWGMGSVSEITSEDVLNFCDHELDLLCRKAEKSSKRESKTAKENAEMAVKVADYLAENGATLGKNLCKVFDVSTSKMSALAKVGGFSKEKTKEGVVYSVE